MKRAGSDVEDLGKVECGEIGLEPPLLLLEMFYVDAASPGADCSGGESVGLLLFLSFFLFECIYVLHSHTSFPLTASFNSSSQSW